MIAMTLYTTYLESAIGPLAISGTAAGITAVTFASQAGDSPAELPACLQVCRQQLAEYFAGSRTEFSLPLVMAGTPFQQQVWQTLLGIPFGQTRSYRELAAILDKPRAVRAVGRANGANRINIIIPCHRVVGADGSLTGYGGGLERKEWLLRHEQKIAGD
ncbi:MAG: methylated-DNA--[protein]-cysteine S-methyltransferase [Negativicutes bacterium]|nr:methylated-DNA--[protein]-cysteine S-methyltransferase [Negativicutes bacterium]